MAGVHIEGWDLCSRTCACTHTNQQKQYSKVWEAKRIIIKKKISVTMTSIFFCYKQIRGLTFCIMEINTQVWFCLQTKWTVYLLQTERRRPVGSAAAVTEKVHSQAGRSCCWTFLNSAAAVVSPYRCWEGLMQMWSWYSKTTWCKWMNL